MIQPFESRNQTTSNGGLRASNGNGAASSADPSATAARARAFALIVSSLWGRRWATGHRRSRGAPPGSAPGHTTPTEATDLGPMVPRGVLPGAERPSSLTAEAVEDGASLIKLGPQAPVIGYVALPANVNGAELANSERAITAMCDRGTWRLVEIVRDRDGGPLLERPGMSGVLQRIADGEACGLIVSGTRLVGRSGDLADLLRRLEAARAALVALDLGLDTSTPQGNRVASAVITLGRWGRPRTAAAPHPLARTRMAGEAVDGATRRVAAAER